MIDSYEQEGLRSFVRERVRGLIVRDTLCRLWRKAFLGGKIVVLMYHEVLGDDQEIEAWTVVKQTAFRRQMEYLRREFQVVGLHEALNVFRAPERSRGNFAVVTFDDGYAGNLHHVLPVVESLGIPVTIFVATQAIMEQEAYWFDDVILLLQDLLPRSWRKDPATRGLEFEMTRQSLHGERRWDRIQSVLCALKELDPVPRKATLHGLFQRWGRPEIEKAPLRPMTIAELTEISRSPYITIGAHSHGHELLNQLPMAQMRASLATSRDHLKQWTGKVVDCFAYPNGNHNADVVREVQDAGFICGCTTESSPWSRDRSPFLIPRIGIGRYDSIEAFKLKVSGVLV